MEMYNYYAMLFRKLEASESIGYEYVDEYKKADGTLMENVLLVYSEIVGRKPIYKLEMQERFFNMLSERTEVA
jgi:hypothetical protein